jgi:hypothetical protein
MRISMDTNDARIEFAFDDGEFCLSIIEDGEVGGAETYMDIEQVKFLVDTLKRFVSDYDDGYGDY